MIFQAKLVNTYIDNLIQLNDFCKTSPFFYFNLPPLYLCSFSPDLPSMQYIEKNPLKYKLQEEHKSYGQIYVSRLHAFPATSERMPKKSLNEAMVGWLSLCPLTLHLPLGRLKFAKNPSILKTLSTVIKSAVVYKSEKLVSLPIVQALTVAQNHLIYKVNNNKKQRELSRSHVSKLKICIK